MERNENICLQSSTQTDTNSKTEAHSYPLWIVGERANSLTNPISTFQKIFAMPPKHSSIENIYN